MLVVDDDDSIRELLKDALTDVGYEVTTAGTADDALRAVEARIPDVIILDMRMPDDGPRFKAELSRRSLHAPVVAISANLEGSQWADAVGARFVAKPFALEDVFAALRSALA